MKSIHFVGVALGCCLAVGLIPERCSGANIGTSAKSGIDISFSGEEGSSYFEEYMYYDRKINDRRVIYIRGDTPILFSHNLNNVAGSSTGTDSYEPAAANVGVIRYKVNRDQQWIYGWGGPGSTLLPSFSEPIAFDRLKYDDGSPVIGTYGPVSSVPLTVTNKSRYFYRAVLDAAGDEWHTITVADDDTAVTANPEFQSSDGRIFQFVVNPKGPCFRITAGDGGQYYTTPPKNYFIPKIYEQISYITGRASIELRDLFEGKVFYRVVKQVEDSSTKFKTSGAGSVILDVTTELEDGLQYLQYYTEGKAEHVRTRAIVRNPSYPSSRERHGDMLWGAGNWQEVRRRISERPELAKWLDLLRTNDFWNRHSSIEKEARSGKRVVIGGAMENAFIARWDGFAAIGSGGKMSYADYAKLALLEVPTNIDPVGFELNHSNTPLPSREIIYRGYYDVNPIYSALFAYDILIAGYRADQGFPNGVTPIEDLYIRDQFASYVHLATLTAAGYVQGAQGEMYDSGGMWDTARKCCALAIAIVMPTYNTKYLGVSGFDGGESGGVVVSFATNTYTWKQVFLGDEMPMSGFPNLNNRLGIDQYLCNDQGQWTDRASYFGMGLMGHCLQVTANLLKVHLPDKSFPNFEAATRNAVSEKGVFGIKDSSSMRFSCLMMLNSFWPDIRKSGLEWLRSLSSTHPESVDKQVGKFVVPILVFFDHDFPQVGGRPAAPRRLRVEP